MTKPPYKLRIAVLFFFFLTLYGAVAVRLYVIQCVHRAFYTGLAHQQYFTQVVLPPERGIIFDRSGTKPLALNHESSSAFILPAEMKEKERMLQFLSDHHPIVAERLKNSPKSKFLWIERFLTDERLRFYQELNLGDIHFINEPTRYYPFSGASQVIGFSDLDNKGISGLELQYEEVLKGEQTTYLLQRDARRSGFYFKKELQERGYAGENKVLALDADLQLLAYNEVKAAVEDLSAHSGSAIVMNPESGELLAMVNYPDIDPNVRPIHDLALTKNQVVTECYEFGSVMKAFAALAVLAEKAVALDEEIDCEGNYAYINGFRLQNTPHAVYKVPFWDAVKRSSNVGIAKSCVRIGPKLYDHYQRLGFGKPTGIIFPGERSGFVNPPAKWSRSSLLVLAFGYEITATLMQLACAFCTLANGGCAVEPQLTLPVSYSGKHGTQLYDEESIKGIRFILGEVGALYKVPGYTVYGKTGTARAVIDGKYSAKEHHYTFGGIVEKEGYKRVIITFINRPRKANLWASQVTAPLFRKIAERMVLHDMTAPHTVRA